MGEIRHSREGESIGVSVAGGGELRGTVEIAGLNLIRHRDLEQQFLIEVIILAASTVKIAEEGMVSPGPQVRPSLLITEHTPFPGSPKKHCWTYTVRVT